MPTTVTILVGQIGSGKTTWLAWKMAENHQVRPDYPQVANLPMKFSDGVKGEYQEDILKFLALKLIKEDRTQMDVYVDEAAQAGLESRGSGLKSTDSRLITLARKANVNLFLASQLVSMVDKRLQWNYDFGIDCNFQFITEQAMRRFIPDYFEYEVYNSDNRLQYTDRLWDFDCERHIFPLFDTHHIPFREALRREFLLYYWAKDKYTYDADKFREDEDWFNQLIKRYGGKSKAVSVMGDEKVEIERETTKRYFRFSYRVGETVELEKKWWQITAKWIAPEKFRYGYTLEAIETPINQIENPDANERAGEGKTAAAEAGEVPPLADKSDRGDNPPSSEKASEA